MSIYIYILKIFFKTTTIYYIFIRRLSMGQFISFLTDIASTISDFVWGPFFLIPLLCGTGLFFTIRLKLIQVRKFPEGWKRIFGIFSLKGEKAGKHGMTPFQALATAIAAQVGTGNLVGAMTALTIGGPGAIFWMWLAAFFGMATIFAEAILAQVYKTTDETGQVVGGPAYYISKGLGNNAFSKFLAGFFAVAIILALGLMGNMVQSNSISAAFQNAFSIPTWATGIGLALFLSIILLGGIKRIASVTEKIVPIMAISYILVGLFIVLMNIKTIPQIFGLIFGAAFSSNAIWGGAAGVAVATAARYGIARGLFSNEAGMGSTPHAHAVAKVDHPAHQGVIAIVSVFIDTFIVLTITVFTVLSQNIDAKPTLQGIEIVQDAFAKGLFGNSMLGYSFISICLFFFAFSTIIGWYYFAESNIRYLFGKHLITPFKVLVVCFVFIGSILRIDLVWNLSDLFNGFMVVPNLVALLLLSGTVVKIMQDSKNGIPYQQDNYIKK